VARAADVKAYKAFQLLYLFIDPDHYDIDEKGSDLRGALLKMTHTIMLKAIAKYCYIFTEEFVEVLAQFAPIPIQVRTISFFLSLTQALSSVFLSFFLSFFALVLIISVFFSCVSCVVRVVWTNAASPACEQHGADAANGEEQPNLDLHAPRRNDDRRTRPHRSSSPSLSFVFSLFVLFTLFILAIPIHHPILYLSAPPSKHISLQTVCDTSLVRGKLLSCAHLSDKTTPDRLKRSFHGHWTKSGAPNGASAACPRSRSSSSSGPCDQTLDLTKHRLEASTTVQCADCPPGSNTKRHHERERRRPTGPGSTLPAPKHQSRDFELLGDGSVERRTGQ
jgi:hypothetical protein